MDKNRRPQQGGELEIKWAENYGSLCNTGTAVAWEKILKKKKLKGPQRPTWTREKNNLATLIESLASRGYTSTDAHLRRRMMEKHKPIKCDSVIKKHMLQNPQRTTQSPTPDTAKQVAPLR